MIDFLHTDRTRFVRSEKGENFRLSKTGKGGTTYAVEKLPATAYNIDDIVTVNIGKATCHEDENFCKKTGRDLAILRMKKVELKVTRYVVTKDRVDVSLQNDEGTIEVDFSLREDKNYSRLEYARIE